MGLPRTVLFLTLLVSLALLAVALELLERAEAEPYAGSVVAQQQGVRVVAVIHGSPNLGDSDGDGVPNTSDNCPAWPNADQSLPPWPVPADDPDCDGFTTSEEALMGTDPQDACANTAEANDEADDRWPPDFDDNQWVNILDAVQMTPPVFNSMSGDADYSPRKDFDGDGWINILDFIRMTPPVFNHVCG